MAEHWPPPEVLRAWDIRAEYVTPVKDVFMVETAHGSFCLKPSVLSGDRLRALDEALNLVVSQGFVQVAPLIPTREGAAFVAYEGLNFYLTEWFDGDRPDLERPDSTRSIARCLAQFHTVAKGLAARQGMRNELGKWPARIAERRDELVALKSEVGRRAEQTKFDHLFLEWAERFAAAADHASALLAGSGYDALTRSEDEERVFCHGDIAARNFIIVNGAPFIIDFDSLAIDVRVYDLSQLVRRTLKHCRFDLDVAKRIVAGYEEVRPLSSSERRVLAGLVAFPQKYWRAVNRHYQEEAAVPGKSETEKLAGLLDLWDDFERFSRDFPNWLAAGRRA